MAEEKLITSASSVNESLKPTGLEGGEPTCNIRLRVYPPRKKKSIEYCVSAQRSHLSCGFVRADWQDTPPKLWKEPVKTQSN